MEDAKRPSKHICICGDPLSVHYGPSAQCSRRYPGNFTPNEETLRRYAEVYMKENDKHAKS